MTTIDDTDAPNTGDDTTDADTVTDGEPDTPVGADDEVTPEYCIDKIVISGSPETVAKKLAAFREDVGPFETLIISQHDWVHKDLWRRHMELVATEMMPRLRSEIGWRDAAE